MNRKKWRQMRVKVKDLKSNPFRDFEKYPINEKKVVNRMIYIKQGGYHSLLTARPGKDGGYELPSRYEEVIALQRSGIDEVLAFITDIDDAEMRKSGETPPHQRGKRQEQQKIDQGCHEGSMNLHESSGRKKIKVSDLKPNPFRNLEKYHINEDKVESLMTSIQETSFWDNILARPSKDGGYEIAYGHHRLFAIQNLGIKEVEIPVRDLDDATMIKIMANENLDEWKAMPSVIAESVRVAKEYLDGLLAKSDTWEDWIKSGKNTNLFKSKAEFGQAKGKQGVGRTIILRFLGGNWKDWMVRDALAELKESEIMQEVIELFGNPSDAKAFRKIVKSPEFKGKIAEGKEKKLAEKVAEDIKKKKEEAEGKEYRYKSMKTFIREHAEGVFESEAIIGNVKDQMRICNERICAARRGIRDLNILLQDLNVTSKKDVQSILLINELEGLYGEIERMCKYLGFEYKYGQQHSQIEEAREQGQNIIDVDVSV